MSTFSVHADSRGEDIARRFFDLKKADTLQSDTILVLIDDKNNRRTRKIRSYIRTTTNGEESFIEFMSPSDVKGTKFLSISETGKDDQQRLFLPALGKIRRIATSDKNSSFMGTEFNYYDLEKHAYEDYNYRFLREDTANKQAVYVVEFIPKDSTVPYSKEIVYLRKDTYVPLQIDFYNKKDALLKTIINIKIETIQGIYIATRVVVDNKQNRQKTLMQVNNIQINTDIPTRIFSIQNLEQ